MLYSVYYGIVHDAHAVFQNTIRVRSILRILSAVPGFVIGAYIPIPQFSDRVQNVCNIFPASHDTILLWNAMLNGTLENIDRNIGGIDEGAFIGLIRDIFTFKDNMFGRTLEVSGMCMYTLCVFVISLMAMMVLYSKRYQFIKAFSLVFWRFCVTMIFVSLADGGFKL
ncbi:MAG: hypothetical protein IJT37_00195 [Lachnospiraceae bacterium]|nr:hypothetical protein [Lachnospiraceae bacterium]